jgi:hypothetical protein
MRRRGCLWGVGGVLGLLLLCCGLGWFVAIPRVQDGIRDELADNLATNVATQIAAQLPSGQQIEPGEYVISIAGIEEEIARNFDQASVEDLSISTSNGHLVVTMGSGGQTIEYSGVPVAEDGRLVMTDMRENNDVASFFLPADKLGDAIERGVNEYFSTQNVQIDDIQLSGDELIIQTSASQ